MPAKTYTSPVDLTDSIREELRTSFANALKINSEFSVSRDKGYYGVCFAMPSRAIRNALSVDREILILVSTFEDQQARTIQTAKDLIEESGGRLDPATFIIIHRDSRGNAKLKKWGREQGLAVLPIFFDGALPKEDALLQSLAHELFSYDVFDVTGPVADDLHFYGRREEARDLAKKLQSGQIRSCFGIRKIGKTSVLHRVVNEVRENFDCTTFLIDAQSDAIFSLSAAQLLNSLAVSLEAGPPEDGHSILIDRGEADISDAARRLGLAVAAHHQHVLFVFDEIDYLTPTSPTAAHWAAEFNPFWRNLRAVYQASASKKKNLSLLVSGVSSKWFSEESIGGVENAALSFVPEEYLSPLPRGAAAAMIRRLGRSAGLIFADAAAELIAETCADMPFWIRKACSFVHGKVDIAVRPFEPDNRLVADYLTQFVGSDGAAMSEVALAHLFRVYPELRAPAICCADGRVAEVTPRMRRTLQKYGLLSQGDKPVVSGQMMATGLQHVGDEQPTDAGPVDDVGVVVTQEYGEWADELAIVSRRRNVLERRLRGVVTNFVRYSAMTDSSGGSAKDRLLRALEQRRRAELQRYELDDLAAKLYWLELIGVIKKEWSLFERIFGSKADIERYSLIVNERPDAHAKDFDLFDAALHRNAVAWFEERLAKF